ncbi:class I SAM-dependent methyltransferase [Halorhodospira halophila]|uniref:Methyltransferase type 12 n=1 Tax=Halorhodospira halophila (strain DSM 244 / SL1) TaxID=349124 RepID=A1WTZ4_HALHL|nr:class I SAM-dependent methyltransferase [Halorhodospira halophila]ABM61156.1 Methyltransferase type 12 [Halorhodospira halophila SL1]
MDWSGGYVSDINYISGFYREIAPGYLSFVARLRGEPAPDPARPFRYAELGCGQGLGTNLLAAANPHAEFVGIDFLPGQIANARDQAAAAGLGNVTFHEASFAEAADWPAAALEPFDYITLHGIYAWVSPANRQAIVRFIERWLKPGGLVYVSYNAMPGWAGVLPFQRLLREHAARHPGRSDEQVQSGLAFLQRLREAGLAYFDRHPAAPAKLDGLGDIAREATYLAHEYLNSAAQPLYFTDVVADLAPAKLDYVGSADLVENYDVLSLPEAARAALEEVADPHYRELLRDYAVNRVFRRDIFIKGSRRGTTAQQDAALLETSLAPLLTRSEMTPVFHTNLGELTGQARIYEPLMDRLARGTTTLGALREATGIELAALIQACTVLVATGQAHPAQPVADAGPARRLAKLLAARILDDEPHGHLPAPAIGSGVAASDTEIVALSALLDGVPPRARRLAEAVWARFRPVGRRMLRDGEVLESERENLRELQQRAGAILRERLPVWQGLGLLDAGDDRRSG